MFAACYLLMCIDTEYASRDLQENIVMNLSHKFMIQTTYRIYTLF
jgi:hypothetical protein